MCDSGGGERRRIAIKMEMFILRSLPRFFHIFYVFGNCLNFILSLQILITTLLGEFLIFVIFRYAGHLAKVAKEPAWDS